MILYESDLIILSFDGGNHDRDALGGIDGLLTATKFNGALGIGSDTDVCIEAILGTPLL